jgi:4a-hydroxytetrahydrobiopterin dehydratase
MEHDMAADQPADLTHWDVTDRALHRTVRFAGYRDAVAFTVRVALEAETANHHPDLLLGWGRVEVTLTSHDVGGVTDRDREMARTIDGLVEAASGTVEGDG